MQLDRMPDVFMSFRPLPPEHFPVFVRRRGGRTLFIVDPRASRFECVSAMVRQWTAEEQVMLRRAYGQPDEGLLSEWLIEDKPCVLYVPKLVRMTGAPALQGGVELTRRRLAQQLHHEYVALHAEHTSHELDVSFLTHLTDLTDLLGA